MTLRILPAYVLRIHMVGICAQCVHIISVLRPSCLLVLVPTVLDAYYKCPYGLRAYYKYLHVLGTCYECMYCARMIS